jgi:hypothetical protein
MPSLRKTVMRRKEAPKTKPSRTAITTFLKPFFISLRSTTFPHRLDIWLDLSLSVSLVQVLVGKLISKQHTCLVTNELSVVVFEFWAEDSLRGSVSEKLLFRSLRPLLNLFFVCLDVLLLVGRAGQSLSFFQENDYDLNMIKSEIK